MTPEEVKAACLAKPGTSEEFPFRDEGITAFKVAGKIFAISRPGHEPPVVASLTGARRDALE